MKKTYISPTSLQFIMQLERIIATSVSRYDVDSDNEAGWTNKKEHDPYDCIWMPKEK